MSAGYLFFYFYFKITLMYKENVGPIVKMIGCDINIWPYILTKELISCFKLT